MRYSLVIITLLSSLSLVACSGSDTGSYNPPRVHLCSDGIDNDNDGHIDFPNDPGCGSSTDDDEADPSAPAICSDGLDNDGDELIDYPDDPGCISASDSDETDPPAPAACNDGLDNDGDGAADYPRDPGCTDFNDNDETDPATPSACSDGIDNDSDGKIDFPVDPGCVSASDNDERDTTTNPACSDEVDNDADGLIDFPADPGCESAADEFENDAPPASVCSDGFDNDGDGKIDFPADPGCVSATDNNETDPASPPACSDGLDNDSDGKIDYLSDPGCTSAADNDETDPPAPAACADGIDNDLDGLTDYPNDPGCSSAADTDETDAVASTKRTRYAMNNQCWAIKSARSGNFLQRTGTTYAATATTLTNAEGFYFKPSALGKYLIYNRNRQLVAANSAGALSHQNSASATDAAEWTVRGVGDATVYPPTPVYNVEPASAAAVNAYLNFVDPNGEYDAFTLHGDLNNVFIRANGEGVVSSAATTTPGLDEAFEFVTNANCAKYPEATSNFSGTPYKGTVNGNVIGHTDAHVHISASEFLGGAEWGRPYHKFGVEHALGSCESQHGPNGFLDLLGGAYGQDFDGHGTDGWPTFSDWPSRGNLTHEAIYWKWLERAWAAGLRVAVNDLVDNETLCELQRNAVGDPLRDCNPMNNAGKQAGTMYGMQDYIDAQYGGRKKGYFQIVHTSEAARAVIENGQLAVVLGIEISNLFNCKLTYSPFRTQTAKNEDGSGFLENAYNCTTDETKDNSILKQIERIQAWGVRQVISIHEFDNAFGGNGIFDGQLLNLGNRENTGGIPSGDIAAVTNFVLQPSPSADAFGALIANFETTETPTGEFWNTYNCPLETEANRDSGIFSGYLWGSSGGSVQNFNPPDPLPFPGCEVLGSEPYGGPVPCYPKNVAQCNARWMTPAGLYTYKKMMEKGLIIDFDHMEMGMKTQLLELAEAQTITYPLVSTHGTFGGTTIDQAERVLRGGGFLYPSNGSSRGFRSDMNETLAIYTQAFGGPPNTERPLFAFGYGTDTNGLSSQTGPRNGIDPGKEISYSATTGFTLFSGPLFDQLPEFNNIDGVTFFQPSSTDAAGIIKRKWHEDVDGHAHQGMISDFVQEIRLEGTPEQMRHLFNSAEGYLRTWQQTELSGAQIRVEGSVTEPDGILRDSPAYGGAFAP